jgi:hypothetical protein
MTDSIAITQSLAGLLEAESADVYDWDASALVEWPNIAPPKHRTSSAGRTLGRSF